MRCTSFELRYLYVYCDDWVALRDLIYCSTTLNCDATVMRCTYYKLRYLYVYCDE